MLPLGGSDVYSTDRFYGDSSYDGKSVKASLMGEELVSHSESEVINLDLDGKIIYQGSTLTLESLKAMLSSMDKTGKDFALRADESRKYGEVIKVMKAMRESGIENVNLVTQAE